MGEIAYLSDATFFIDTTSDFFISLIVAGILSRFIMVFFQARGLEAPINNVAFFVSLVRGRFSSSISNHEESASNFSSGVASFVENRLQFVGPMLFFLLFYGMYCGFSFSIGAVVSLFFVVVGWIWVTTRFVGRGDRVIEAGDLGVLFNTLRKSDHRPRTLLVLALSIVLFSYVLATIRGHNLKAEACSEILFVNGQSECMTVVAKSSHGIFGYSDGEIDVPKFVNFDSISKVIGHFEN